MRKLLKEDRVSDGVKRSKKVIRNIMSNYPDYFWDQVARDPRNNHPFLTQRGEEQTVLDYICGLLRTRFYSNNIADYYYMPGITRIAMGELSFQGACNRGEDNEELERLGLILQIISMQPDKPFDYNLNGLSYNELNDMYGESVDRMVQNEFDEINNSEYEENNDYDIVKINNFAEARRYLQYTPVDSRWCICEGEHHWDAYTNEGANAIYFLLKRGFESIPEQAGENAPLDEYGLSMICVGISPNGMLTLSTTRWNHINGGEDKSLSSKQLSQLIGQSIYNVCKPVQNQHYMGENKMKRTIIITEEQERNLRSLMKEDMYKEPSPQNPDIKKANKPYCINPDKVLLVKNFLDKGFKRGNIENIGNDGFPQQTKIVAMLGSNGDVLRNLVLDDLQELLIDRFKNMFLDIDERSLFMKQVVNDWYDNKIGTFGNLSVNHL